ncbi:hypothetical protein [Enhygromyxa salina]|uniref:Uncharacterized protein n=1 Tax=Enhygromyxa salina TaxID=215803 RepID=A0A2S9XTV8_9BACT|nr:hypothetical protein [Enhygromyxa salina]PRP96309.1 hypothetical protein ENSA7_71240 [Enhygromyxa salina]
MPINYDMLHKLYTLRPTARELFGSIIQVGVDQGRTTVDQLIEASSATRRQAITLLRELEEAGCGEFKVGRKGHPSRLVWVGDPREIARRVVSGELPDQPTAEQPQQPEPEPHAPDSLEVIGAPEPAPELELPLDLPLELPQPPTTEHATREQIEHTYVLRPDFRVSVALPANVTRREAEVLADWIRNLSFER